MTNNKPLVLLPLLLLLSPGCSTPVTLDSWQKSVEDYIWQEANGDPNSLRNIPSAYPYKQFSVFSHKNPNESTDAVGLLLAHRQINARPGFIFLLALVNNRSVQDIRLAAMTPDPAQFLWTLSPPNPQSLQTYRLYKQNLWRKTDPDRPDIPPSALAFPGEDDLFDIAISPARITVTHRQSRAQWAISLPAATAAPLNE